LIIESFIYVPSHQQELSDGKISLHFLIKAKA